MQIVKENVYCATHLVDGAIIVDCGIEELIVPRSFARVNVIGILAKPFGKSTALEIGRAHV